MSHSIGAAKVAAGKLNMTLDAYRAKRAAGLKWCHRGHWVSVASFGAHRGKRDGLREWCRACANAAVRRRDWFPERVVNNPPNRGNE